MRTHVRTENEQWRSSVMRTCKPDEADDCVVCKYLRGRQDVRTMTRVIRLLDYKLAEREAMCLRLADLAQLNPNMRLEWGCVRDQ